MLTIEDIRKKVNEFPSDRPVEDLLDELVLMYKIQKGIAEADNGEGRNWEDFEKEMELWWKSK
jgi:hypothetical protein